MLGLGLLPLGSLVLPLFIAEHEGGRGSALAIAEQWEGVIGKVRRPDPLRTHDESHHQKTRGSGNAPT
ncbi:hypothetical protein Kisp01_26240 [Kineosporia sp. NBRC 101677]|nr:hypothetical protein Kisp01_26240 [Kineosporia sp. NBRC 101677]